MLQRFPVAHLKVGLSDRKAEENSGITTTGFRVVSSLHNGTSCLIAYYCAAVFQLDDSCKQFRRGIAFAVDQHDEFAAVQMRADGPFRNERFGIPFANTVRNLDVMVKDSSEHIPQGFGFPSRVAAKVQDKCRVLAGTFDEYIDLRLCQIEVMQPPVGNLSSIDQDASLGVVFGFLLTVEFEEIRAQGIVSDNTLAALRDCLDGFVAKRAVRRSKFEFSGEYGLRFVK